MNPNHGEDLSWDPKPLPIIIHDHTSSPTEPPQTAISDQQKTTMLGNNHDSPAENVQDQEQEPIAQNEADASISSSEDESIIDDTLQSHKQKAQLCKSQELNKSAKKGITCVSSNRSCAKQKKNKKIETAALHPPSGDTTPEQTENLHQMI
ncbi:uncharacterized protein EAF01_002143 [Botrytis porri]|uniref:Uncharacterized protein n=1 Tax=Botrytis porri TaxID=87229 RepID=A0A4Z1L624_9HELO|nr:uncharacterized protein EAF01_002143 [Botrytis porri]KAF7910633.1 hypothetical protein EAF01_002143 [Botrytis porri]TGO92310.1 hypothetical protein BPOR_0006g00500 [Botrytis porri]